MADIKNIEFNNVHGLFGGENVLATSDGILAVQKVDHSGVEKRYIEHLDKEKISKLFGEITKTNLAFLKMKDRQGIPDEARIALSVTYTKGKKQTISVWENSNLNPDEYQKSDRKKFDLICRSLKNLLPKDSKPVYQGKYPGPRSWMEFTKTF